RGFAKNRITAKITRDLRRQMEAQLDRLKRKITFREVLKIVLIIRPFIGKDKILFFRESSGIPSFKRFQFPRIEVREILAIPFSSPKIKKDLQFISLIKGIQQSTSVLCELKFNQLHIVVIIHFQHKFAGTKRLGFL